MLNYILVYQTETDGEIVIETVKDAAEVIEIAETLHDEVAVIHEKGDYIRLYCAP